MLANTARAHPAFVTQSFFHLLVKCCVSKGCHQKQSAGVAMAAASPAFIEQDVAACAYVSVIVDTRDETLPRLPLVNEWTCVVGSFLSLDRV